MAYCPNCTQKLVLADEFLSEDLKQMDYYSHYCERCKAFWHLHINKNKVTLSASDDVNVGRQMSDNLLVDLKDRLAVMER
jgi:hypothetical protein